MEIYHEKFKHCKIQNGRPAATFDHQIFSLTHRPQNQLVKFWEYTGSGLTIMTTCLVIIIIWHFDYVDALQSPIFIPSLWLFLTIFHIITLAELENPLIHRVSDCFCYLNATFKYFDSTWHFLLQADVHHQSRHNRTTFITRVDARLTFQFLGQFFKMASKIAAVL